MLVETKYPASNHKTRTEIKINIVDVNDNAPEILQQPINIFIPRNGKIGTVVKQVYILYRSKLQFFFLVDQIIKYLTTFFPYFVLYLLYNYIYRSKQLTKIRV